MKARDTAVRNKDYHCLEYDHDQMGDIFLVACGQEKCDPGVTYGPELRDSWHLHIVKSGRGVLKVRGMTFRPHGGQMFLLRHNETVEYTADAAEPWEYCWVTFNGSEAALLAAEIGFDDRTYCLDSTKSPDEFYELILRMYREPEMNVVNDLKRRGILLEFLALAMEATQTQEKKRERRNQRPIDDYVRKAEDFIRYNYATVQVADVAEFVGFTRSYFCTSFKKKTGMSPQEYLIQVRMNRAKALLAGTNLRVLDIAKEVGYEDPLHFSRIFHRHCGMSAREYREQI